MRKGFLTAITIFLFSATWVSSQAQPLSTLESLQTGTKTPTAFADLPSESLSQNETQWVTLTPSNSGNRSWVGADFLLWSIKPGNSPPLASTGPLGPGTTILHNGSQDYGARLGGQATLGTWLDDSHRTGIEASLFYLGGPDDNFSASSTGLPGSTPLARPLFNVNSGLQDQQFVAFPTVSSGTLGISSTSQLLGAQLNVLCNLCCSCPVQCCPDNCTQVGFFPNLGSQPSGYRVDMITGVRYLNLNENLTIRENILLLPGSPAPGDQIAVVDKFGTRNNFYGGQIGVRGETWRGAWFVNATGKVALGDMHQEVRVNGYTTFTPVGLPPVTQPGGLLALPTNIGNRSRDRFAAIPEVGFNVGRQVTDNLRIYAGYNVLYISSVVRPGDQIDNVINPTQLPTYAGPGVLVGDARPAPLFRETDLWAQGLNLGMQLAW